MLRQSVHKSTSSLLTAFVVIYAIACIAFGGSGRDGGNIHGILQIIAGMGIAALVLTWPSQQLLGSFRVPIGLLASIWGVGFLQCIPLPVALWQALPGRSNIVGGFASLDLSMTALPISLDVEATLSTMGYTLPPMFVLIACAKIGTAGLRFVIPWFLVLSAAACAVLGFVQVIAGTESTLYFYEFSNRGYPVGPFANVNHFATLQLMAIPFGVYVFGYVFGRRKESDSFVALAIVACATLLMLGIGVAAAGSLAIYLLSSPVVLLTFLALKSKGSSMSSTVLRGVIVVVLALGIFVMATSPYLKNFGVTDLSDNPGSRYQIWLNTVDAIRSNWLFGAGLGTFQSVMPLFESADSATSRYVARAHNEFLQLVLETGLFGIALITAASAWFGRRAWILWGGSSMSSMMVLRRVATIAVLVPFLHSIVDFPARTPAVSIVIALCVALVCLPDSQKRSSEKNDAVNPKRLVL